jgi:hypothetical protein
LEEVQQFFLRLSHGSSPVKVTVTEKRLMFALDCEKLRKMGYKYPQLFLWSLDPYADAIRALLYFVGVERTVWDWDDCLVLSSFAQDVAKKLLGEVYGECREEWNEKEIWQKRLVLGERLGKKLKEVAEAMLSKAGIKFSEDDVHQLAKTLQSNKWSEMKELDYDFTPLLGDIVKEFSFKMAMMLNSLITVRAMESNQDFKKLMEKGPGQLFAKIQENPVFGLRNRDHPLTVISRQTHMAKKFNLVLWELLGFTGNVNLHTPRQCSKASIIRTGKMHGVCYLDDNRNEVMSVLSDCSFDQVPAGICFDNVKEAIRPDYEPFTELFKKVLLQIGTNIPQSIALDEVEARKVFVSDCVQKRLRERLNGLSK